MALEIWVKQNIIKVVHVGLCVFIDLRMCIYRFANMLTVL